MTHSLNARLLASFTLIIIVIFGSVFFFAYRATHNEISQLGEHVESLQDARIQQELTRYFQFTRSWDGVQPLVVQWGKLYGRRIILTDTRGTVVADSDAALLGDTYDGDMPGQMIMPMFGIGPAVGSLHVVHGDLPDINRASLQITYASIGRFFLWGGLLAIAIAFILTFVLSRHFLAPVKALSRAARQFGKGDFSRRVESADKGELGELAISFNTMADDLERTERLRRHMVADIAHELRTPLSNLSGYLEAIRDGVIQPDEEAVASLSEEAATLARLVDDLQELSLSDAGELKLITSPDDIGRLVRDAVNRLAGQGGR